MLVVRAEPSGLGVPAPTDCEMFNQAGDFDGGVVFQIKHRHCFHG